MLEPHVDDMNRAREHRARSDQVMLNRIPLNLNHVVAILGLVLAISSYLVLHYYGVPEKICVGAGILGALVVAIFWSCVMLGTDDEDE